MVKAHEVTLLYSFIKAAEAENTEHHAIMHVLRVYEWRKYAV